MIHGHGDDLHRVGEVRVNFSSNVYNHFDHTRLFAYLAERMPVVCHYPEPTPESLEALLALQLGLSPDEVMVTNGATEAIYLLAQSLRGKRVCIPQPTFAEYADACRLHGVEITSAEITSSEQTDVLWICNPNNPTGEVLPLTDIREIITGNPHRLLIVDASYEHFTQEPLLSASEACRYPQVLMLHSMTKQFGIPGLRLGYLTGASQTLAPLRALRMPWSVNSLALEAGKYLVEHAADYALDFPALMAERERMAQELQKLGFEVYPSQTHMLLCQCPQGTASEWKDYLVREHALLIRDASNFCGLTDRHFRIAIQTAEEDNLLLSALRQRLQPGTLPQNRV